MNTPPEEPAYRRKLVQRKGMALQRIEYAIYKMLGIPLRLAPPAWVESWSNAVGRILPPLMRKRTALAEQNLRMIYPQMPEEERLRILKGCWQFFSAMVFRFLNSTGESLAIQTVFFDKPELVKSLVAQKRGLLIVTAHYGDWERGLHVLNSIEDVPVNVVVRALDNDLLERELYRERLRANVFLTDRRTAARSLVKTLAEKGVVVMLADQSVRPKDGVLVPFLGVRAWTTPAPARLALRADCPIICVFSHPGGTPLYVDVDIVIDPRELPPEKRNAEAITELVNDAVSRRIHDNPELWLWMHDRWKAAPKESPIPTPQAPSRPTG